MNVQPIMPRIIDPGMLPVVNSTQGAHNEALALSQHHEQNTEQSGLFTTLYDNKMIVIIIVLVILIIGIFAYVVIRKNGGDEEDQNSPPPHDTAASSQKTNTGVVRQSAPQNMENVQQQRQSQPMQASKSPTKEEVIKMMKEMDEMRARTRRQQNDAISSGEVRSGDHNNDVASRNDVALRNADAELATNADIMADAKFSETLGSGDEDISEYMRASAVKTDDFDDKALQIIDEQGSLNEHQHKLCGADTPSGTCRLRALVDGRCRKHIGV